MNPPDDKAQTSPDLAPSPDLANAAFWQRMQELEDRLALATDRLNDLLGQTQPGPTAPQASAQEVEEDAKEQEEAKEEEDAADEAPPSRLSIAAGFLAQIAILVVLWIALFQSSLDPASPAIHGLSAAFNRQLVENISYSDLYAQYRAYTSYTLNHELQQQLELALANPPEAATQEELLLLNQELEQARRTAASSRLFFSSRYLNADGSYDRDRQLGEAWSQAARQTELDPLPYFTEADQQRRLVMNTISLLLWLTIALCLCELIVYFNRRRSMLRWSSALTTVAGIVFVVVAMLSLIE
jgi:hypothetical protein